MTKSMLKAEFSPNGRLIGNPMLGGPDKYKKGSPEWCFALASNLQGAWDLYGRNGVRYIDWLISLLKEATETSPHPWEVWPEEAKGNPKEWIHLATGDSWDDMGKLIRDYSPEAWNEISEAIALWEMLHRTEEEAAKQRERDEAGRFIQASVSQTGGRRDQESAQGIRRRIHKRAKDGDPTALSLVEQLASGSITVNQAAIAAGMRVKYLRVPDGEPSKVAESLVRRKGREWAIQLANQILNAEHG